MLSRLAILCTLTLLAAGAPTFASDERDDPEWALLYWMPYDSSSRYLGGLVQTVRPTMKLFRKNVRSEKVVVVVQRDVRPRTGNHNGHIRTIFRGGTHPLEEHLTATDSASPQNLQDYLEWARRTFRAKRWAIIMLGHSGGLTQISPDEYPDQETKNLKWMHIDELAAAIEGAWRDARTKPDLLVLQTCNQGMIEVAFSLRNSARLTLASQAELGAHHPSYTDFLVDLSRKPFMKPAELAALMMKTLDPSVFLSQVIVENGPLDELPARLEPLLQQIGRSPPALGSLVRYEYPQFAGEENYSDFLSLLSAYSARSKAAQREFRKFSDWMATLMRHRRGMLELEVAHAKRLTGLGVLLPLHASTYEANRSLPFYRATQLWDRLPKPSAP